MSELVFVHKEKMPIWQQSLIHLPSILAIILAMIFTESLVKKNHKEKLKMLTF